MKKIKKDVYVVNFGDTWAVKVHGDTIISTYTRKKDAIKQGKTLAKIYKSELKIQGKDGKWQDSISYGNDPYPPKG